MTDFARNDVLPPPLKVPGGEENLKALLASEWLLTNGIGTYASSSAAGCNTRRYHGLLVAATQPPVGRVMTLSTVMETLTIDGETYELATNEFEGAFAPCGAALLREFRNDVAATFVYRVGDAEFTKEVLLAENANAVAVRYTLRGASGTLRVRPFAALRDFHHLRLVSQPSRMTFETLDGGIGVADRSRPLPMLCLLAGRAEWRAEPQWWYGFRYRADMARGQDGYEDLYTPGSFTWEIGDGEPRQLNAALEAPTPVDFDDALARRGNRLATLAATAPADDEVTGRLAVASDAFVVRRHFPDGAASTSILAGYHWFADWGRDTFIALPGLLLTMRRFEQARSVFRTFARHVSEGMVPNRFDDYSSAAHYNSMDASLWFILAAERYMAAARKAGPDEARTAQKFWRSVLEPAAESILRAYQEGTRFGIHADADGLVCGGDYNTQLTWMDAKLGKEVMTPRHGKPVEVNALWYCAHRILAERCDEADKARHYADAAGRIGPAFVEAFWDEGFGWLADCVTDGRRDMSLRPNQLFAASLPYSPLSDGQRQAVLAVVREKLLTPRGLRTLSPEDPRYRRRYGISWESRDRAYHQGTVWAWLAGAYVEASLRAGGGSKLAVAQAKEYLDGFGEHLTEAGNGTVSEIFDGDAPHAPHGCIAQAWSVAELLRARELVAEASQ